jgi:hypothetical protein
MRKSPDAIDFEGYRKSQRGWRLGKKDRGEPNVAIDRRVKPGDDGIDSASLPA